MWKDAIFGFPVSPGSAEALVGCGGKIKYVLIAYILCNICAKSCCNRTVYVKIIASCNEMKTKTKIQLTDEDDD